MVMPKVLVFMHFHMQSLVCACVSVSVVERRRNITTRYPLQKKVLAVFQRPYRSVPMHATSSFHFFSQRNYYLPFHCVNRLLKFSSPHLAHNGTHRQSYRGITALDRQHCHDRQRNIRLKHSIFFNLHFNTEKL